ncbi:MAG: hypothetical protein HC869_05615, partial [Rhodospirillales bacterium]|nr:hypothetical protein [Rhodospirillales bacterium]
MSEVIDFFWGIVRQQFEVMLSVTVAVIALGALYVYVTPPAFTARAILIIEKGKVQAQLGEMARELPVGVVEMESQTMLIKSESVALAVVKKLNLDKEREFIEPPKALFGDKSTVESDPVRAALAVLEKRLTVNRTAGNIIEIEALSFKPELAAEIANAFADCYIEDRLKSRSLAA